MSSYWGFTAAKALSSTLATNVAHFVILEWKRGRLRTMYLLSDYSNLLQNSLLDSNGGFTETRTHQSKLTSKTGFVIVTPATQTVYTACYIWRSLFFIQVWMNRVLCSLFLSRHAGRETAPWAARRQGWEWGSPGALGSAAGGSQLRCAAAGQRRVGLFCCCWPLGEHAPWPRRGKSRLRRASPSPSNLAGSEANCQTADTNASNQITPNPRLKLYKTEI